MIQRILALMAFLIAFPVVTSAASFNHVYRIKTGVLTGDTKTSIYFQYSPPTVPIDVGDLTVPIALAPKEIGEFILQQNSSGGTFTVITNPSASQLNQARGWPIESGIVPAVADLNFDGNLDVFLQGVSSEISGALDLFLIAPDAAGAAPIAVKSIGAAFTKFVSDLNAWEADSEYFEDAWIPVYQNYNYYYNTYSCNGFPYEALAGSLADNNLWNNPNCTYTGYYIIVVPVLIGYNFDYANYSAAANNVSVGLESYINSTTPVTVDVGDADIVWTNTIGAIALPSPATWPSEPTTDVPVRKSPNILIEILKRIGLSARAANLVGGILYWSDTAENDTFEFVNHYSYADIWYKFTTGMKPMSGNPPRWYGTDMSGLTGSQAQQLLALPPHSHDDDPPDAVYVIRVDPPLPTATTVIGRNFDLPGGGTVTRTGQGSEMLFYTPTPRGSVYGPVLIPID